jgi:hypothetical protein
MKEELGNNDLADGRIVGIRATCNNKERKRNWWNFFQLGLVLLISTFIQCFGFG